MRLSVVGTGYVGLVAGTCFAECGSDVTCIDTDAAKVELLERGEVPLYEPGLAELIRKNRAAGRLRFTTEYGPAVGSSRVVFIAVGTPEGESGEADVHHVLEAAAQIGRSLRDYTVVVTKSTVPVGTAQRVREVIANLTRTDFDVASNPEFLKEGAALEDFFQPDRVLIGTRSLRARRLLAELYAPLVGPERPLLFMDERSAELTKYASNAMLASRISFMNDMAALCERLGADVEWVRQGMGADRRIGSAFLSPGIGYGGSCFPKDVKALLAMALEHGVECELLRGCERTNQRQKQRLLQKAVRHYGRLEGRSFAVWGLAFKPRTDDLREAPSVELIEGLLGKGARVSAYDPVAQQRARRLFGDRITYAPGAYAAAEGAEGLFLCTEWSEFQRTDLERLAWVMKTPVLFDGRNLFDPEAARAAGFTYYGIGRSR